MITSREMTEDDFAELDFAIAVDTFHPGMWTLESFTDGFRSKRSWFEVFSHNDKTIAFVKYRVESESRVRIFTIWTDFNDRGGNSRVIVFGINQLVNRLGGSQFTEIAFSTENSELATFCTKVLKFTDLGNGEYVKQVKEGI